MSIDQIQFKVQRQLQSIFGEVQIDSDGNFKFPVESTMGFGSVHQAGDLSVFQVFAPVLFEVPITHELAHYVATEFFMFGNLLLRPADNGRDGNLTFEYRILADNLDESELRIAVSMVCITADDLDDKLQKRFGGKRLSDL
jgi:hypothetical protein